MIDPTIGQRFKRMRPVIGEVIECHLPGDFDNWEDENVIWDGKIKTVRNGDKDPRTEPCLWKIFSASEMPDEHLGFINLKEDAKALQELESNLRDAVSAVKRLNIQTRMMLSQASAEKYRQSVDHRTEQVIAPDFNLLLVEQALRCGIPAARAFLETHGLVNRADRRAAAVAGACREVYEIRSGKKPPRTALDSPQKKDGQEPKPAPFTAFAQEIFKVLGITSRVSSALSRLESFKTLE